MELYDFITFTENLICSDDFEAVSMTNLDDYLQKTSQSSMVRSLSDYFRPQMQLSIQIIGRG